MFRLTSTSASCILVHRSPPSDPFLLPCPPSPRVVASGRTRPRDDPPDRYADAPFRMPVALRPVVAALSICTTLAVAGCDTEPGFAAAVRPPTLVEVAVTPDSARLDTDAPTATVPLAVEGTLDSDGPVEVRVLVRWMETDSLVAEVAEEVPGAGRFRVEAPVEIPRGATGDYRVQVSTEGADGRPGDQAASVLRFEAGNLGPPTVTVNQPDAVARPAGAATVTVPIVATVTDPDGRANVAAVVLQLPDAGGVVGRLFDGGDGADQDEGDGRYSGGLVVDAGFEPGAYTLEVVAIDRAGEASEPVPFTFTVR